jgi:hypothetical protein
MFEIILYFPSQKLFLKKVCFENFNILKSNIICAEATKVLP